MKILIFDNYDSFTYNLVHMIKELGYTDIDVKRNDQITIDEVAKYDKIVLSPGPGLPDESGILKELIRVYGPHKPILGVCLGHQAIGEVYGAKLAQLERVYHGHATEMHLTTPHPIFKDVATGTSVGRYHSWVVRDIPSDLEVIAQDETGEIMAMHHKKYDLVGVQFHPESIMTKEGMKMMKNWLES